MRKSIYATTPNLPGVQKSTTLRSIASSVETVDTTKGAFTLVYEPRSRGIEKQSIILIQEENRPTQGHNLLRTCVYPFLISCGSLGTILSLGGYPFLGATFLAATFVCAGARTRIKSRVRSL